MMMLIVMMRRRLLLRRLPKSSLYKAMLTQTRFMISIFRIKLQKEMNTSGKLTNLQIELLKMFNYDLTENQLRDIKDMLGKYFAETARREADKLWEEQNWTNDTMEQWANEHLRKKRQD